ncbi:hypothetical protein J1D01_16325 [Seonamhaeicola sp. NFXS20]
MDCLMKKKKQLKKLKKGAKGKLNVLRPSQSRKGEFMPSFVYFDGYSDLFTTIEALINVCVLATQGDNHCPPHSKALEVDIRKTLELASSLMPFEEGEFLDEAYQVLVENEELK